MPAGLLELFYSERQNKFYLKEHRDFNWLLGAAQASKAESTFDSRRDSEEKKTLCVFSRLVMRQTCSIGLRSGE